MTPATQPIASETETKRGRSRPTPSKRAHIQSFEPATAVFAKLSANQIDPDYIRTNRLLIPQIEDRYGRFTIREFNHDDVYRLREMNGDLFFAPLRHLYGPIGFLNAALNQQKLGRARKDFYLAVVDRVTSELIGSIMLYNYNNHVGQNGLRSTEGQAEIAYFIDPKYRNINIATDAAVGILLRLGKVLGIKRLYATVHPDNEPSKRLLNRLGFRQAGDLFASRYKGDPERPDSYNEKKRLIFAPRLPYIVDYGHFLDQLSKGKIITTERDIAAMNRAREDRQLVVAQRQMASMRLQGLKPGRIPNLVRAFKFS